MGYSSVRSIVDHERSYYQSQDIYHDTHLFADQCLHPLPKHNTHLQMTLL